MYKAPPFMEDCDELEAFLLEEDCSCFNVVENAGATTVVQGQWSAPLSGMSVRSSTTQSVELAAWEPSELAPKISISAAAVGATAPATRNKAQKARRRASKGVSEQVHEAEQQLQQEQQLLEEQLQRRVFLKERLQVLEELLQVKEQQDAQAKLRGDAAMQAQHNEFTAQELAMSSPSWFVEQFNTRNQRMALLLAAASPILTKYPHIMSTMPDASLLAQIPDLTASATPLTTPAPPSSPCGAAPVPSSMPHSGASIRQPTSSMLPPAFARVIAAAYGLDLAKMVPEDVLQLASLAALAQEHRRMVAVLRHMFVLRPQIMLANAVHMNAVDACSRWDALTSSLAHLQLGQSGMGGSADVTACPAAALTVADEAHWQRIVARLRLTNQQQLRASVLWNILSSSRAQIQQYRAQLAAQMQELVQSEGAAHAVAMMGVVMGMKPPAAAAGASAIASRASGGGQAGVAVQDVQAAVWRSEVPYTEQVLLLQRMKATLDKERSLMALATEMLWDRLLTPVQASIVRVDSHPFKPDELSILSACAAGYNDALLAQLAAQEQRPAEGISSRLPEYGRNSSVEHERIGAAAPMP